MKPLVSLFFGPREAKSEATYEDRMRSEVIDGKAAFALFFMVQVRLFLSTFWDFPTADSVLDRHIRDAICHSVVSKVVTRVCDSHLLMRIDGNKPYDGPHEAARTQLASADVPTITLLAIVKNRTNCSHFRETKNKGGHSR
jgi:hypothetical protein